MTSKAGHSVPVESPTKSISLVSAPGGQRSVKMRKRPSCGFLVTVGVIFATAGIFLSPTVVHHAIAQGTGGKHLGYGIHFHWNDIRSSLTVEEKFLVDKPVGNERAIALLFNKKLGGVKWDEEGEKSDYQINWFPKVRNAKHFLDRNQEDRGVCRHRVVILAAILKKIGIPATIETGIQPGIGLHAWVKLPTQNLILDPFAGTSNEPKEYYEVFEPGSVKPVNVWQDILAGTYY